MSRNLDVYNTKSIPTTLPIFDVNAIKGQAYRARHEETPLVHLLNLAIVTQHFKWESYDQPPAQPLRAMTLNISRSPLHLLLESH